MSHCHDLLLFIFVFEGSYFYKQTGSSKVQLVTHLHSYNEKYSLQIIFPSVLRSIMVCFTLFIFTFGVS